MSSRLDDRDLKRYIAEELEDAVKYLDDEYRTREWEIYTKFISERGWRNKDFEGLCGILFEHWPDIYDDQYRREDEVKALRHFSTIFVEGAMAATITGSRDVADDLYRYDRKEFDRLDRLARKWLNAFSNRGRERNRGGGYSDRDRDDRRDRDRDRDRRHRDDRRSRDYRDDRRDDRRDRDHRNTSDSPTMSAWADMPVAKEPEPVQPREPEPVYVVEDNGPDFSQAEPHLRFTSDGMFYELSVISDMRPTPKMNEDGIPLPPMYYDPRTQVKYYVRDNETGNIKEVVKDMADDEQYLTHQTLHDPQARPEQRRTLTLRKSVEPSVDAESADTPSNDEILSVFEGIVVEESADVVVCDGETALINRAVMNLGKAENNPISMLTSAIVKTPLILKSPVAEQVPLLVKFGEAKTLADAAQVLREESSMDDALYYYLNDKMTQRLANILRYQFQFGMIANFNFAKEWSDEVIPYLRKHGNDALVRQIASKCVNLPYQVAVNLGSGLEPKELVEWLPEEFSTEEQAAKFNGIIMAEQTHVIAVNRTIDEIGLGKILQPCKRNSANDLGIGTSHCSNYSEVNRSLIKIYEGLQNVFYQNQHTANMTEVKVVLSDKNTFKVLPYAGSRNQFVLFQDR